MRNLFLVFLLVMGVGVAAWQVQRNMDLPETLQTVTEQVSVSAPEAEKQVPEQDNQDSLRVMADKIISRPIKVSAQLSVSDRKRAEEKIKEISVLIKSDYDDMYAWLDLGSYRRVIGDFQGAVEAWNFLTVIRPKDFTAYHNLGDLYGFYLKDYPKSEENYLKSIENNPSNIQAYLDLAVIYGVYKEKAGQAEPILLLGLQANPGNPGLQLALDNYRSNSSR